MKWKVFLSSVLSLAIVAGCNGGNNATSEQEQISDELDPT
ncbi:hypothetical protein GCM10011409_12460 [Lentibacillus populi]|uniref:Uncharacterized protein n=3 Tax=Bacillaceae TaxID=186817 RepID=A0A9W5TVT3_9BACI|nr:hypothetical protein GCM10011409_12460 [Lentibacillus populi]